MDTRKPLKVRDKGIFRIAESSVRPRKSNLAMEVKSERRAACMSQAGSQMGRTEKWVQFVALLSLEDTEVLVLSNRLNRHSLHHIRLEPKGGAKFVKLLVERYCTLSC